MGQELAVGNGEDTLSVAVLELLVLVAFLGCSFTPLFGALWPLCDLFQAHGECLPVFTALGFRERTVNPSAWQARVGELSRARAAGTVG